MLVDCRGTTHILNDESKFINFAKDIDSSSQIVELPDGSKYINLVLKEGHLYQND